MAIIKGPRSALSEFIKQHGIKTDKNNKDDKVASHANIDKVKTNVTKKTKKLKFSKPNELITDKNKNDSLQEVIVKKIILNRHIYKCNDKHLEMISAYLSRRKMFDVEWFKYLANNCDKQLIVYDCSMIKDKEYIIDNLKIEILELHQCGQLTDHSLNTILPKMPNLRVLRITGAYLVTDIKLPIGLKILDLTNCSRLDNSIISEINKRYTELDELRLSFCYKITDKILLKPHVKRLYLDETKITEKFYKKKNLVELSIQRCPDINLLNANYSKLTYLNIDNISTLENIKLKSKLKIFKASGCHGMAEWIKKATANFLKNVETLDISNISFDNYDFLFQAKTLKNLNLSWCDNVTDSLISELVEKLDLETLIAFGCFDLTQKTAELAYKIRRKLIIIGIPAETKYTIQNL